MRALAELARAARGRLRRRRRGARLPARARRSRSSSAPASCSRASPASCRTRRSAPSTCSSTARASSSCTPTPSRGGTRVLVHDDLLATGGTAAALCELVEQLGGEVVGCGFLVELAFLERARAPGAARGARAAQLRVLRLRDRADRAPQPHDRRAASRSCGRWSATRTTCRAGGRAWTRVEDVDGRRLHRGDAHRQGQSSCAPTSSSCAADEQAHSLTLAAAARGHAVRARAELGARRSVSAASRAAERHERDDRAAPDADAASSRASAASWCAARPPRRSTRRSTGWSGSVADGGARRTAAGRAMRWWGWGDPAHPPGLPADGARRSSPRPSASPRGRAPPVALVERAPGAVRARPSRALAALRAIVGAEHVRDDHAERVAARRRQGLPRPRAAARRASPRGRRTRSSCPAAREQVRALLDAVRARVAGGRPVRRRHERRRRRRAAARRARGVICARHAAAGRACSRSTASRARSPSRAGMRAPALERHLARARAHARALPAVLRVRLARRLRGDALGRPGLERLRRDRARWCSACAWRRPAGEIDAAGAARRAPPARRCASCWSARRARSG